GLRRNEEWVRAVGAAVIALAAFGLFSIQLQPAPIGYLAVLNGRAAAGAIAVAVLYGLVAMHRRFGHHIAQLSTNIAVLTTTASLLTLSLLTSEIDAFWAARGASSMWSVAREGLQSVGWAGVARLLQLHFATPPLAYVILANARVMTSI